MIKFGDRWINPRYVAWTMASGATAYVKLVGDDSPYFVAYPSAKEAADIVNDVVCSIVAGS